MPTLDIRVEQKGSLVVKDNKKVKKMKKKKKGKKKTLGEKNARRIKMRKYLVSKDSCEEKGSRKAYSMVANLIKTVVGQKTTTKRRLIQWWQIW